MAWGSKQFDFRTELTKQKHKRRRKTAKLAASGLAAGILLGLSAANLLNFSDPAAALNSSEPFRVCGKVRENCVVDGDTFWSAGEKIRIADIDTPEINGKCASEKERARQARDRLGALLSRGEFVVHRQGTDRYGRTLAVVTSGGRSVGDVLVSEGLARTWSGRREPWC
ncbi:thermonuclease family protein [Altererythrobacter soli]|uniref:Thermonuclease family protein n=2 Tax=Croceibacterium soli TaxID=1739690 RepID=A0A6I4UVH0_9SPHN|nr:thermonuclease family protein [Croceibacterium soli]